MRSCAARMAQPRRIPSSRGSFGVTSNRIPFDPRSRRRLPSNVFHSSDSDMYSVTKRIDFCYGHRLLEYDGICKHPHGHNAVAEVEVRAESLDAREMVCDFSEITRVIKGWIPAQVLFLVSIEMHECVYLCWSSAVCCPFLFRWMSIRCVHHPGVASAMQPTLS